MDDTDSTGGGAGNVKDDAGKVEDGAGKQVGDDFVMVQGHKETEVETGPAKGFVNIENKEAVSSPASQSFVSFKPPAAEDSKDASSKTENPDGSSSQAAETPPAKPAARSVELQFPATPPGIKKEEQVRFRLVGSDPELPEDDRDLVDMRALNFAEEFKKMLHSKTGSQIRIYPIPPPPDDADDATLKKFQAEDEGVVDHVVVLGGGGPVGDRIAAVKKFDTRAELLGKICTRKKPCSQEEVSGKLKAMPKEALKKSLSGSFLAEWRRKCPLFKAYLDAEKTSSPELRAPTTDAQKYDDREFLLQSSCGLAAPCTESEAKEHLLKKLPEFLKSQLFGSFVQEWRNLDDDFAKYADADHGADKSASEKMEYLKKYFDQEEDNFPEKYFEKGMKRIAFAKDYFSSSNFFRTYFEKGMETDSTTTGDQANPDIVRLQAAVTRKQVESLTPETLLNRETQEGKVRVIDLRDYNQFKAMCQNQETTSMAPLLQMAMEGAKGKEKPEAMEEVR